ncbi:MAG: bifunctional UDP-sugar hydrolase/5'-nucleotidase [Syntrophomonadaceae bacterium]|nr:bifunctional UDP-sugar hydrolase/5'-nucleotidase [Syntrophomonadaceae bacterium]
MKKWCICTIVLCLSLLLSLGPTALAAEEGATLRVLFTHDLHSNLEPVSELRDGVYAERGGFARLKTVIDQEREEKGELLLVDAGDFAMGTLYHTIFSTEAAELMLMGQMGYDAVTLGNHEFDAGSAGLAAMLDVAADRGDALPALVYSNIDWSASRADETHGDSVIKLQKALKHYGAAEYIIMEKQGLRIALFGLMGLNAGSFIADSGIVFEDAVTSAQRVVTALEQSDSPPDMIVCLSHCGTSGDSRTSEDQLLATAVPEIDLIISGHAHNTLKQPVIIGDTVIAAAGCYGAWLGSLNLVCTADGRWQVEDYKLIPVDETLDSDADLQANIAAFKRKVQRQYLNLFDYRFDALLATSPFAFTAIKDFGTLQGEDTLGNLITDSYIYSVNSLEGDNGDDPIHLALVPSGAVRASFGEGDITVSDVFNISAIGYGNDGLSGYPLVSFYVTGEDIKRAAEIDATVSDFMPDVRLYCSGITYTFNPHRLPLNRVTEIKLRHANGTWGDIEDQRLYRVITSLYPAQMLHLIEDFTYGLICVTPRDRNGQPINELEQHIIYDANGNELKEWVALATYLESFPPQDSIPVVPEYYDSAQGRKIIDDSTNIVDLVKQPNKIAFIVLGIALIPLLILALIIGWVIKKIRRAKPAFMFKD